MVERIEGIQAELEVIAFLYPRILENILSIIHVLSNPQNRPKHHFAIAPTKLDICQNARRSAPNATNSASLVAVNGEAD
jgi:hypothetical protein